MHYWRVPRTDWRSALTSVRDLGLHMVETYIPWAPHEQPGADGFDFGDKDPQLDVGAFLDLVHSLGMFAFVRPGPHINAELTRFGIPSRIIEDPACQARSPTGKPVLLPFPPQMFPVPSYASQRYREETGRWFEALGGVISPRRYPDGPIVLLQVDNEATYFFRNASYCQDYHPDAVAFYRRFLRDRYQTPEALPAGYARSKDWESVLPPEHFDAMDPPSLLPHLDWAENKEALVSDALAHMQRQLGSAHLDGLPTVHNLPLGDAGLPVSPPRLAQDIDLVGLDYYHAAREHRTIKRRTLYLAGTFPLPYAPEVGVGAPPWFTPLRHHDSLTCALTALAFGLRGFNLYMGVDRDRWFGAPIDRHGKPREEATVWAQLIRALKQTAFHELQRRTPVRLVVPADYRRLSRVTHLLGGVLSSSALEALGGTPVDACSEESLGFKGPIQVLWWRNLAKMSDALTRAQVPYAYVDSDAPQDRFNVSLLVVPSYEFCDAALWDKLRRAAASGTHVLYGPSHPTMDRKMAAHEFPPLENAKQIYVDNPAEADGVVQAAVDALHLHPEFSVAPTPLECTVHRDALGARVAFIINPERQTKTARVSFPGALSWTDVFSGETWSGSRDLQLPVPGLTVRMFRLSAVGPRQGKRPSVRAPGGAR